MKLGGFSIKLKDLQGRYFQVSKRETSYDATALFQKIDQRMSHFQLTASSAPDILHTTPTFQLRRIFDKL